MLKFNLFKRLIVFIILNNSNNLSIEFKIFTPSRYKLFFGGASILLLVEHKFIFHILFYLTMAQFRCFYTCNFF
ncbi:28R protein [Yaba-like disease virus]|uniref:28R protein n=1 Tax=Yaba-like disease virus TaxID=132475 RepID=Q9DHT4_YLDV|nr:28R protein [Yaba-like disease virus]CAC21266.1 28R protein [Yaba-like disease virus]